MTNLLVGAHDGAQRYGLPVGVQNATFGAHFTQPETEDKKLRKDPLEVLALKVPFGNRVAFPNEVPWPGQLRTLRPLYT